jgi:hypothetical protein
MESAKLYAGAVVFYSDVKGLGGFFHRYLEGYGPI